ncbi:hypothetical protein P7B02_00035 [Caulobacter segnis]|uniref:hypothetical protein n=1 Tax=Caulobacter segnis TaxID=88688 RepID=UPI00241030E8|nr:hypothetical protein [Caulobacter segnis]MDG2519909.1 hypothetical protein [Caulobacter segnis]
MRWTTVAAVSLLIHAALLAWLGLRAPRPQYGEPADQALIEMELSAAIASRLRQDEAAERAPKRLRLPAPFDPAPPRPHPPTPPPPGAPAPDSVVVDLRAALKRAGVGCSMALKGEEREECQTRLAARTMARDIAPLPATAGVNAAAERDWSRESARRQRERDKWTAFTRTPGIETNDRVGKAKEIPF